MEKFRSSQVARENVFSFVEAFYDYTCAGWFGKRIIRGGNYGVLWNDNLYGLSSINEGFPQWKTRLVVSLLFQTAAGQQILQIYTAIKKLTRSAFLNDREKEQLRGAGATMRQLWLIAHQEAGLLADDNESAEAIKTVVLEAKYYIASYTQATREIKDTTKPNLVHA